VNTVRSGLEYLSKLTPWNGRGGFALEYITKVLERLGNPQDSLPSIHIAGTNGKGSVSSAVSSILAASGYRVGLNTSPHLEQMNERLVVDGRSVSDEFLGEFAFAVRNAAQRALVELSFHEAITAIAFLGFREVGVEWMVMEVGLGGRLDASNVISRPAATAIVTIDYDHQAILGNTLAEIAREKAGITKPGTPMISGFLPKEAANAVSKVVTGVPLFRYGKDFGVAPLPQINKSTFGYWDKNHGSGVGDLFHFSTPLPGMHQGHNMAVAAKIGLTVGMSQEDCRSGIEQVFWPGRLERIETVGRPYVLDCAHNGAGVSAFIEYIHACGEKGIDLTFGVLDTKNWQGMLQALKPHVGTWRLLRPESERALPEEELIRELGVSGTEVRILRYNKDYERCVRDTIAEDNGHPAFVTGSMYMVGKLRSMLSVPPKPLWKRAEKQNSVI
jgi:dihydrofolate synthase/folylpolyglutamate synthase